MINCSNPATCYGCGKKISANRFNFKSYLIKDISEPDTFIADYSFSCKKGCLNCKKDINAKSCTPNCFCLNLCPG